MKKCYIINGAAGVGKDTFVTMADYCFFIETKEPTYNISSVDKVKIAAEILGWNKIKDEKGRKFLSDLKDLSTNAYDGPFNYMLDAYKNMKNGIFFFHIREPQEILRFKQEIKDVKTILIKRDSVKKFNNHADKDVELFQYDYIIDNNGSLEYLETIVSNFVCEELRDAE